MIHFNIDYFAILFYIIVMSGKEKLMKFGPSAAMIGAGVLFLMERQRTARLEQQLEWSQWAQNRLMQRLEKRNVDSVTDVTTGLLNKRGLQEAYLKLANVSQRRETDIEEQINTGSLIVFDVDHFKPVNDNFGHEVGDSILFQVGEIISENKRDEDISARPGGDEFVLLLPNTSLDGACALAERLRNGVLGDEFMNITLSLGIAEIDFTQTLAKNQKRADNAMYAAKAQGRNRVVTYDPTLHFGKPA